MSAGEPMKVVIAGDFSFPQGQGAAARVFMYAKALQAAGARVHVVSVLPPSPGGSSSDGPSSGVYKGVPHEYAAGTRERAATFLRRRLLNTCTVWRTLGVIASGRGDGPSAVLVYSRRSRWIGLLTVLGRLRGAVVALDLCEFPLPGRLGSPLAAVTREVQRSLLYPSADVVIPISTYLDRYTAGSPWPPQRLRVPLMVDPDAFVPEDGAAPHAGRVVFCGALGRLPEVERALRSFQEVSRVVPDAELLIVGTGPPDRVARARDLADALDLGQTVSFVGEVPREELPALLATAQVLILPRPAGVFSSAGLPNKLGEYLATGRPVVTTATGDIPLFLQDGVEAYLVDPADEDAFSTRLLHVLQHPQEAALVGARGREAALREFDYRLHGRRLLGALERCADARRGKRKA